MVWLSLIVLCAACFGLGVLWAGSSWGAGRDTYAAAKARYMRDVDAAAARLLDEGVADPWDAHAMARARLTQERQQLRSNSLKKL